MLIMLKTFTYIKLRKHKVHRSNQNFYFFEDYLFLGLDSAVSYSFLKVHLLLGFVVFPSFTRAFVLFALGLSFKARAHVGQVSGLLIEGQPRRLGLFQDVSHVKPVVEVLVLFGTFVMEFLQVIERSVASSVL